MREQEVIYRLEKLMKDEDISLRIGRNKTTYILRTEMHDFQLLVKGTTSKSLYLISHKITLEKDGISFDGGFISYNKLKDIEVEH